MGTVYPLLISIPHGGDVVPPEVKDTVSITDRDVFYDGDTLTREIPNSLPISDNPGQPRPLICLCNRGDNRGMPTGRPITCPPEWIQALAESFRRVFANEGELTLNNPFLGGYISQVHYEEKGISCIQIETYDHYGKNYKLRMELWRI
jgi:N-formylglutamate amidohydrolase